MTFTEIVTEIAAQANLTSSEATTRIGRKVNRLYKRITASMGLDVSRRTQVQADMTLGVSTLTFTGIEKITAVIDKSTGSDVHLECVFIDELKEGTIGTGIPTKYAIYRMNAGTVQILTNTIPQDDYTLYADGLERTSTLSGSQEPAFPESFHDILVEKVLADEWRKKGELALAKDADDAAEELLSDLRMFIAKEVYQDIHRGKAMGSVLGGSLSSGGSGSSVNGAASYTQTGLITFDRDPSAPFAVTASSAVVANLDADMLDGFHETSFAKLADNEIIAGNWEFDGTVNFDGATDFDATVNMAGAGSLVLPQASAPSQTAEGSLIWDLDTDTVKIGDGSSRKTLVDTTSVQILTNKTLTAAVLGGTTVVSGGQLAFPAAQSASADANTLDDYEEGTWTPVLTFATPGNLSVVYTTQLGSYTKIGRLVVVKFNILTSTFTHTTAAGAMNITGLPFTVGARDGIGSLFFAGITKANYTQFAPRAVAAGTLIDVVCSGSGQAAAQLAFGDMPSATNQQLVGSVAFFV